MSFPVASLAGCVLVLAGACIALALRVRGLRAELAAHGAQAETRTRGREARTLASVVVSAARAYARRKRRKGYWARAFAVSSECIVA